MDHINNQDQDNTVWNFRRIVAHQGPLHPHSKEYKGSRWNVSIEWENGGPRNEAQFTNVASLSLTLLL